MNPQSFFEETGSTRVVSLMRILAVAVAWSRLGAGMVPAFNHTPGDLAICAVFWVASTLAFLGVQSRISVLGTGLAVLAAYYIQGHAGGASALASHHVFAHGVLLCLLALTPCGGSFSVDSVRGTPSVGPVWGQRLIVLQISVMYLGGTWAKTSWAWLSGARMEQLGMYLYTGSDHPGPLFSAVCFAMGAGSWAIELAIAILVWFRRARFGLLVLVFLFHGLTYYLTPVSTFSVTMFVFILAVLDPGDLDAGPLATEIRISDRPMALLLLPILALPLLRQSGLAVPAPSFATFDTVAIGACEVEYETADGVVRTGVPGGRPSVLRRAKPLCELGPVRARGRCGTLDGWETFRLADACRGAAPHSGRRRSAL